MLTLFFVTLVDIGFVASFLRNSGFLFFGFFSLHLGWCNEWSFTSLDPLLFMSSSGLVFGQLEVVFKHNIAPDSNTKRICHRLTASDPGLSSSNSFFAFGAQQFGVVCCTYLLLLCD
jgi:hypothetical protein